MAYLKNNYKLMYENRAITAGALERHLRATKTLPATTDANLTYKKADGTTVDPKTFKFIKEVNGNFYGSISGKPSEATVKFSVYSGNDLIYGDEVVPPVQKFSLSVASTIEAATPAIYGEATREIEVESGATKVICIYPESGKKWKVAPTTCLVNGVETAITSTAVGNLISLAVTVTADTIVNFNVGETEDVTTEVTITANKDTTKQNFEVRWGFAGQPTGHEEISRIVESGTLTRIYIEPDSLLRWDAAPTTCLVNNVATSLAMEGEATIDNKYYIDVTPSENTTVVFNTGSTQPVQP